MDYVDNQLAYDHRRDDGKHPAYYTQDGMESAVDAPLLESDTIQSPHQSHYRKDSFANSSGILSPTDSHGWDHSQYLGRPIDPTSHPYEEPGQLHHGHYSSAFPQQLHPHPPQWKFEQTSGNSTPTTATDMMPPPPRFDPRYQFRNESGHAVFNQPGPSTMAIPQQHYTNGHAFAGPQQVQTPMSPHSHPDWMAHPDEMGMEHDGGETRPAPKHIRPNSVELTRRDGIRKKNSRIDIPSERNVRTIDELIDKTTDEDLLKELKQQKRLLRNREAALASRQRKKKHTEDLEVKEKSYNREISGLRNSLAELTTQHRRLEEDRESLMRTIQTRDQQLETLQARIREMCEENSGLRGKINMLTDQLEAVSIPMSAAPSTASYTDFNAGMEALNVGRDEWDSYLFSNSVLGEPEELAFDPRPEQEILSPTLKKQSSTSTIVPPSAKIRSDVVPEQPIASSMINSLLLVGAWFSSAPGANYWRDIPSMPAELHAAAPTVLDSLLSGGGLTMLNNLRTLPELQSSDQIHQATFQRSHELRGAQDRHRQDTNTHMTQHTEDARSPTSASRGSQRNPTDALSQTRGQEHQIKKEEMHPAGLVWEQIPPEILSQFRKLARERDREQDEVHSRRNRRPVGNGK